METLSLPLNCMKDIQQRVSISFPQALSNDLCSHIITDKQWLQENVLCLLSNAVKYSNEGTVTIHVSKVKYPINHHHHHDKGSANDRKVYNANANVRLLSSQRKDIVYCCSSPSSSPTNSNNANKEFFAVDGSRDRTPPPPAVITNNNNSNMRMMMFPSLMNRHDDNDRDDKDIENPLPPQYQYQCNHQQPFAAAASSTLISDEDDLEKYHNIYLRIEVEDHGIGLSDDAMTTLFSPFKQAQRLAGGTGLGLFSLAKRIEALDGRCGVEKRRDNAQGSLFWFEIPYRPDFQHARRRIMLQKSCARLSSSSCSCSSSVSSSFALSGSMDATTVTATTSATGCSCSVHSTIRRPSLTVSSPPSPLARVTVNTTNTITATNTTKGVQQGNSEESKTSGSGSSGGGHLPLRILLVDDSPAILKMTSMMLLRHKHHVTTATNGAEAVKKVEEVFKSNTSTNTTTNTSSGNNGNSGNSGSYNEKKKGFDVILMDLQMPVMDGLEATKRLRLMEKEGEEEESREGSGGSGSTSSSSPPRRQQQHMIIIGVSANSDSDTAQESIKAGADAFIAKPFSLDTFYQTCATLLTDILDPPPQP
eukprot:scaffold1704_cov194-Ochromonas_danica.AAC.1